VTCALTKGRRARAGGRVLQNTWNGNNPDVDTILSDIAVFMRV
jgi:hypothetical protein